MSRRRCPIAGHRDEILYALEHKDAVIVLGAAGSGKSTQLPRYLVEGGWAKPPRCVVSAQPRKGAAQDVAARIANDLGCDRVGDAVGLAVAGDERWDARRTRILVATDGWLLRTALHDPLLKHFSVVLVDEAHERSLNQDLLMGLVKKVQKRRRELGDPLRVVVALADGDEDVEKFFGRQHTAVARIDGRRDVVDVFHSDAPRGADYVSAAADAAHHAHEEDKGRGGCILVFLPGAREVDECCQLLNAVLRDGTKPADLLRVYAGADARTLKQASVPSSRRRICVATAIAETSVAVADVRVVIDAGFERLPVFDENANAEVVATTYASQQTAERRAARAGGSGEAGKCYRLYTEEAFRTLLPPRHEPASRRSELAAALLQLKAVGVSNVLDFDWPSPPTELLICAAFEELMALRAIDDAGELTKPDGARLALAPCGPRAARFLLASLQAGCSEEALDVACVLATKRTLRRTDRRVKEEQKRVFRDEVVDLDGDHATYVKALRAFREAPHSEQFCTERGLDSGTLRAAERSKPGLERWLTEMATEDGVVLASCGDDGDSLRKALCAGFFARAARFAADATFRTLRADREISLHPMSVHAEFGTPPEYAVFCAPRCPTLLQLQRRSPHCSTPSTRLLRSYRSLNTGDFGRDATGASVARHVSRCDPRVLIAEAGEYYELRGGEREADPGSYLDGI